MIMWSFTANNKKENILWLPALKILQYRVSEVYLEDTGGVLVV